MESFAEAKPLILRARKRRGFHMGNKRSWEVLLVGFAVESSLGKKAFVESFARAKLSILRARKRQGST